MAETIRDVVIRVALEQKESKLKIPGLEEATKNADIFQKLLSEIALNTAEAAGSQEKLLDALSGISTLSTDFQDVGASITNAVAKLGQMNSAIIKVQESSTQMRAVNNDWTKEAEAAYEEHLKGLEEIESELLAIGDQYTAKGQELSEWVKQLNKVEQAGSQAARGAFELARGIALTFGQEDDLQKWLNQIAKIQGAYDIFEGTTKILTLMKTVQDAAAIAAEYHTQKLIQQSIAHYGVNQAARTQAAGTLSVSTATSSYAVVANTSSTLTYAWAGAMVALRAGLTILSRVFLVTSVAMTAYSIYQALAGSSTEKTTDAIKSQGEQMEALRLQAEKIQKIEQSGKEALSLESQLGSLRIENTRLENARGLITEHEYLNQLELDRYSTISRSLSIVKETAKATAAENGYTMLFTNKLDGMLSEITTVEQAVSNGTNTSRELLQTYELAKSADQNTLKVIDELISKNAELVNQKREELDVVKRIADQEQKRADAANEVVGRLNSQQANELKRLSDTVKGGGQLNERQVERLEQLTGGQGDYANKFYQQRGKDRGAADLLAPFGVNVKSQGELDKMQQNVAKTDVDLKIIEDAVNRRTQELEAKADQINDRIANNINKSISNILVGLQNLEKKTEKGFNNKANQ